MSLLLWISKMQDNSHIRNQPRTCCNKVQFGKSINELSTSYNEHDKKYW
jgi:hypothetical protein